jgi:2-phospho-L-lactate transferase/gluconeogenesis factor (CofD/UPF0052 family)
MRSIVSSKARAKGTRFESDIVRYLGTGAERLVQTGSSDQGDIKYGRFILQAKDQAQYNLSGAVDDARNQLAHYQRVHPTSDAAFSVAVIKRRRRGIAEGYVVMTLEQFNRVSNIVSARITT